MSGPVAHPHTMTTKSNAVIVPNSFRPHIPACDRLTRWLTPFGVNHLNSLATPVPPNLILQGRLLISKSVTPSTLNNYAAGLLQFTQFCDEHHIPESLRKPASEDLLVLFVSIYSGMNSKRGVFFPDGERG